MIFFSAFTLPELGPVARLSGCSSVHSGTRWTWRICLFAKRAASACGSRQRFGPVVFSSAKSKKRADGNMEGISLGWAKKDGRAELWRWFCVPGAKRRVCMWGSDAPPSSCSHPFFLRVLRCSVSGDTPASQPPCEGFMVDRNFVKEFISFLVWLS